jgi:hypothetical protein
VKFFYIKVTRRYLEIKPRGVAGGGFPDVESRDEGFESRDDTEPIDRTECKDGRRANVAKFLLSN